MRRIVVHAIDQSGLAGAWRLFRSSGFMVLTYHGFRRERSKHGLTAHEHMRLHIGAFRRHLEHLVTSYRVITLSDAIAYLTRGRGLPKNAIAITFDDGYRSCFELAFPLLKEFEVPATLFVATDFVFAKSALWHDRVEYAIERFGGTSLEFIAGGRVHRFGTATMADKLAALRGVYRILKQIDQAKRDGIIDRIEEQSAAKLRLSEGADGAYMPVEVPELKEMANSGLVDIGCHTKTHAILSRCGASQLAVEIASAKRTIEECLGGRCEFFCYPNGTRADFNDGTRRALVEAGFAGALTTVPGRNRIGTDPMELLRVTAPADFSEFKISASGLRADLGRAYHSVSGVFRRASAEDLGGM